MNQEAFDKALGELKQKFGGLFFSYTLNFNKTITPRRDLGLFFNRLLSIVHDVFPDTPIKKLRILDLGSYEGVYSIPFAQLGAQVVSVEGREINCGKLKFAKDFLGLKNFEAIQADVRTVTKEKYGTFDIVLACGLMYHLDAPSVFNVAEQISKMATRVVIIDTHVALSKPLNHLFNGQTYWGRSYKEFEPNTPAEQKKFFLANSLDNNDSFWLTRVSWLNLLKELRFTAIYECLFPFAEREMGFYDRATLVALKNVKPNNFFNLPPMPMLPEQLGEAVLISQSDHTPTLIDDREHIVR